MASARTRATGVAVLAVLLVALTGCSAQRISFLPVDEPSRRVPIGGSFGITCVVDAPDPALVTRPVWKDPNGNVIGPDKLGNYYPSLYTKSEEESEQSQMLVLKLMTYAMAGNYTCESSYTNTPIAKSIIITTNVPLTWNNANDNQVAIKGETFKVMCEVTAEPPPKVSWSRDGVSITTGDRYVVHTNGLLIKNVQESDDGTYTCDAYVRLTGEIGMKSIRLEVHTSPEIVEHETNVVMKEGEANALTCRAIGKPEPEYTWTRTSTKQDLSADPRFSVNKYTGELRFLKVEALDYGAYTCYASNGAGQNISVWEVEVLVPPKIYEFTNITKSEGTDAVFECKATGRPAPVMSFRKLSNRDPYIEGNIEDGRISIFQTKVQSGDQMVSTGVFSISNLMRSDDGLYECLARNPYPNGGEARKNGHLTVQFKPTFENLPEIPVWTWNAQPTNISCLAESIPNATIKWRFHDSDLVESPYVKIYGSGPYSYVTIHPSDRSLYGYYKCIATNLLGEAVHTIQLREAYPPGPIAQAIVKKLSATTVEFDIVGPGEDMGPPIIAYTTQYKDNRNNDWTFAKNRTWSVNSPYVVEELLPTVNYDFRIAAVNQVGVGNWGFSTTVTMPRRSAPDAPTWREKIGSEDIITSDYTDRFELRWKIPAHNGEPIDSYKIELCPVVKVTGDWRVTKDKCQNRELKLHDVANYMVSGLAPETRYHISLQAHNALGLSPAAQLRVQTRVGVSNGNDGLFFEKVGNDQSPKLSSGAIIGLALAGVLLFLIIVDLVLFCWKRVGVIASLCTRQVPSHTDDESKLGSPKPRAPPSPAPLPPPVKLIPSPTDEKEPLKKTGDILMKRNSSVEFDGHRTYATSGGHIIGKNSAV